MNISATMKHAMLAFVAIAFVAAGYFTSIPQASALTPLADIQAGDLFRGESFSAGYYMSVDGRRYVFPNQATYDTWYNGNFDDVKFISDLDLTKIQIGGNVTYKPGTRMIKINTDPKTYMPASNGTLRHIGTEEVATAYYGTAWNTYIDDLSDGFFTNYTIGDPINDASEFDRDAAQTAATSIDNDRGLIAPAEIQITDSGYSPIDVTISVRQGVRFTNNGSEVHTATSDDLSWGTGTMESGESYIRVFKEAGIYTFFDSYDSGNTGAIYVE